MPKDEIERREGAVKYRTLRLKGGKYLRLAIVRKSGPENGHTLSGPIRREKS